MLTRADILVAIANLEDAVHAWERSTDPSLIVGYNGRPEKMLDSTIEAAAVALFELCDRQDVEEQAWDILRAVDHFDDEFTKFGELAANPATRTNPGGTTEMWGAYNAMLRDRVPRKFDRPTPIKQMMAEGINKEQIAKAYHWLKAHGPHRAMEMIQEELDAPGTHYDPATWVNPREVAYRMELAGWFERRALRIQKAVAAKTASEAAGRQPRRPAHESLDELILQGTNLPQIIKMKPEYTEEDVQARAAELGVALDSSTIVYASYRQAQMAREMKQARSHQAALEAQQKQLANEQPPDQIQTYPEFGDDITGRVLRMHEDGIRPGKIAEALRGRVPNAPSPAMIGKIIKDNAVPTESSAQ